VPPDGAVEALAELRAGRGMKVLVTP